MTMGPFIWLLEGLHYFGIWSHHNTPSKTIHKLTHTHMQAHPQTETFTLNFHSELSPPRKTPVETIMPLDNSLTLSSLSL